MSNLKKLSDICYDVVPQKDGTYEVWETDGFTDQGTYRKLVAKNLTLKEALAYGS